MAVRIVQSRQNSRVKELRAAIQRPARSGSDLIALEGFHLLAEALTSGIDLVTIFVAVGQDGLLDDLLIPDSVEILALPSDVLFSAVSTESPQPVAALARPPAFSWSALLSPRSSAALPLLVVLAGIQDPGNLGTILRSAEAFGATGVISLPGTVSRWNPKAMRASAGSVFRLPFVTATDAECFSHLHKASIQTLAAMAHEAEPLPSFDLNRPSAFVLGSEGSGLSPEFAALCDGRITIPCPGPVESLNAAIAASILLYETARQRSQTSAPAPLPGKVRRSK